MAIFFLLAPASDELGHPARISGYRQKYPYGEQHGHASDTIDQCTTHEFAPERKWRNHTLEQIINPIPDEMAAQSGHD